MIRKLYFAVAVATSLACSQSFADFNYDFTTGEGFADGALANQNGFVAQGQWIVANSAGTGEVTAAAPAFQRLTADGDLFDWNALNVGHSLILNVFGLNTTAASGQIAVLGLTTLTQADGENPGGNGNSQMGGQITTNGTNYFLDEGTFAVSGGAVDTGIALGTSVDYQVTITKQSATTADIFQSLTLAGGGGGNTKTDLGFADQTNGAFVAPGTANLDNNIAVIFQTQNGSVGATSFGGLSAQTAVPEPASCMLIGLSLAGLCLTRRR